MSLLGTERVRMTDWHKGIREITKQLDRTNIKILTAMWRFGPRNLLEISRRTGIPFTSVYHRIGKIESKSHRVAVLIPQLSKLGLMRMVLLVNSNPGSEDKVTAALTMPNLWRSVNRCEGAFTHVSVQVIPVQFVKHFRTYLRRLCDLELIADYKMIATGQYIPNFPEFKYYDPARNQWTFDWGRWLAGLKRKSTKTIEDPASYVTLADKKDLLIVKELEKNARTSFADIAPLLGITLQGVKYHFDKRLVATGIVKYFDFEVLPYPEVVSAYHEILLSFASKGAMNRFYSIVDELFFVRGVAKVLRQDALMIRTCILQNQVPNMFSFFSRMARDGILESYSSVRQDFMGRVAQSISYELFDDKEGWTFDLEKCLSELSKIAKLAHFREKIIGPAGRSFIGG